MKAGVAAGVGLIICVLAFLPGRSGASSFLSERSLSACTALVGVGPDSGEVLSIVASSRSSSRAVARLYTGAHGCFHLHAGPYLARVGARGVSARHREGDETTPLGVYPIGPTIYGIKANPGVSFRYQRIVCGDWWDEDPSSSSYNEFVALRCGATPRFGGASEALWRVTPAYDYFAVIEYNVNPVRRGAGSGIFLHVSTGIPTTGCISLARGELLAVLRALDPARRPVVSITVG